MRGSILLTGSVSYAAAGSLMETRRGEMQKAFPSFFGSSYERAGEPLRREFLKARALAGSRYALELKEGGVFGGLWKAGEDLKAGMDVEIRSIPIPQQTIEILEYAGVDPYTADSSGCLLIISADAYELWRTMREQGIRGAVIGSLTDSRARRLLFPDHIRYLDRYRGAD